MQKHVYYNAACDEYGCDHVFCMNELLRKLWIVTRNYLPKNIDKFGMQSYLESHNVCCKLRRYRGR